MKVETQQITPTATLTSYVLGDDPGLTGGQPRPAVLVLPGGGYRYCSPREAEPLALAYLAEGFDAFVLEYATGDHPWETSYADALAGLERVRDHAQSAGTHPAPVAVVGFSAGGHLAASLGVSAPRRPDALVLGYPVTLASFGPVMGKRIIDTVEAVDDATPPTFLFSTQGDRTVPIEHSLAFCSALARHGVPFESHIYLLGPHGISLAKPLTATGRADFVDADVAGWVADSVRFLHQVLGDYPVTGDAETFATYRRQASAMTARTPSP